MTLLGPRGRGVLPLALLTALITVVCALGIYTERHAVAGWLPAVVGETAMRTSVLGMVLGAALAAWLTAPLNNGHHRWRGQTSPRPAHALSSFIIPWALLAATALIGVTGAVGLFVGRLMAPLSGHPDALASISLWVMGTWAWLLAALFVGGAIGVLLPYRWAPLVAAGLIYASYAFDVLGTPGSQRALLGPSGAYGWMDLFPSPAAAALRLCLAVAVAVLAGAVLLRRTTWAVAAVVVALIPLSTIDSFSVDELRTVLPADAQCVRTRTEVCVPEPWAQGLTAYADAVDSGLEELPPSLIPARVTTEADLAAAVPGGLQVSSPGGAVMVSALPDREAVLNDLGEALFLRHCTASADAQLQLPYLWAAPRGTAPDDVHSLWSPSSIQAMPAEKAEEVRARAARFAALSAQERTARWEQNATAIGSCTLAADALP